MEQITLNLRTNNPPEVFKSIRVIGHSPGRFIANFRYIRLYYKDYDYKSGDILDKQILESVKSIYPDSHLYLNVLTLFDKQYEDCLVITKGANSKTITTYFYPIINYLEEIPKNITGYHLGLKLNLLMNPDDITKENIFDTLLVNVHYEELQNLIKTIKPI